MMIKFIGKIYSASMEWGSDPAETYEIFRKLNQSYMQHIRKKNVLKCFTQCGEIVFGSEQLYKRPYACLGVGKFSRFSYLNA
jgi:hypothetical protein